MKSEPNAEQMKRAHRCMTALLDACRKAKAHGGRAMDLNDVIALIEASDLGALDEGAPPVTGPFYPRGVQ